MPEKEIETGCWLERAYFLIFPAVMVVASAFWIKTDTDGMRRLWAVGWSPQLQGWLALAAIAMVGLHMLYRRWGGYDRWRCPRWLCWAMLAAGVGCVIWLLAYNLRSFFRTMQAQSSDLTRILNVGLYLWAFPPLNPDKTMVFSARSPREQKHIQSGLRGNTTAERVLWLRRHGAYRRQFWGVAVAVLYWNLNFSGLLMMTLSILLWAVAVYRKTMWGACIYLDQELPSAP